MEQITQVLNGEKVLNESDKVGLSLKDIAKGIKQQLKKDYKNCKFSIKTEYYSMGCSLHISIMETDFKIIMPFEEISEEAIFAYVNRNRCSKEDIKAIQLKKHHQLNGYLDNEYNKDVWNNGVFLTKKGFNLVKKIVDMTNKFNWDNSDSQSDYFDVNFYLHINIGKWDKDYIEN